MLASVGIFLKHIMILSFDVHGRHGILAIACGTHGVNGVELANLFIIIVIKPIIDIMTSRGENVVVAFVNMFI